MNDTYEHIQNLKKLIENENMPIIEEIYRNYSTGYLTTLIPLYIADTIVDKRRIPEEMIEIVESYIRENYSPELIENIKETVYPINMDKYRENIGRENAEHYMYEEPQEYEILDYDYTNWPGEDGGGLPRSNDSL